eukprot:COSAG05_NODE_57_length_23291_cov_75.862668_40_plen_248_part_00
MVLSFAFAFGVDDCVWADLLLSVASPPSDAVGDDDDDDDDKDGGGSSSVLGAGQAGAGQALPAAVVSPTAKEAAAAVPRELEEAAVAAPPTLTAQQRAAQAQAERLGAGGALQLEGHPIADHNGVYRRVGQELHGGFPDYEHVSGTVRLYRHQAHEEWRIGSEVTSSNDSYYWGSASGRSGGRFGSAGGEVPVGARAWQCSLNGASRKATVTVRELVRAAESEWILLRCAAWQTSICVWPLLQSLRR